jgi:hypothetical protein
MTALSLVFDFPIEFLRGDAHLLARKALVHHRVLRKERTMSLTTYPNLPGKSATSAKTRTTPAVTERLPVFIRAAGRWIVAAFDAVLEARAQKVMFEAELYLNRCKHTSKNDDDLPVLR